MLLRWYSSLCNPPPFPAALATSLGLALAVSLRSSLSMLCINTCIYIYIYALVVGTFANYSWPNLQPLLFFFTPFSIFSLTRSLRPPSIPVSFLGFQRRVCVFLHINEGKLLGSPRISSWKKKEKKKKRKITLVEDVKGEEDVGEEENLLQGKAGYVVSVL